LDIFLNTPLDSDTFKFSLLKVVTLVVYFLYLCQNVMGVSSFKFLCMQIIILYSSHIKYVDTIYTIYTIYIYEVNDYKFNNTSI